MCLALFVAACSSGQCNSPSQTRGSGGGSGGSGGGEKRGSSGGAAKGRSGRNQVGTGGGTAKGGSGGNSGGVGGSQKGASGANSTPQGNFTDTVNRVALDMVFVKGGTYQTGCDICGDLQNGQADKVYEEPVHSATVSDSPIGKYEVAVAHWKAVMGATMQSAGMSGRDHAPVIGTIRFPANAFACEPNKLTGRPYRLTTDAEWEFAVREGNSGGVKNYRYSGSEDVDAVAWHVGNSGGHVHAVGTKASHEFGVCDMSGNSFEWAFDWLASYTKDAKTDAVQLNGTGNRTRRGGQYGERLPKLPTIANPTALDQSIAKVEPERMVSDPDVVAMVAIGGLVHPSAARRAGIVL